jgi:hypothetical protein
LWWECYHHVSFNYTQLLPDGLRVIPEIGGIAVYSPPRRGESTMFTVLLDFLSEDFSLTKRHLGVALLAAGVIVLAGMGAAEVLSVTSAGIGTMEKLGIAAGVLSTMIGLTLIPLGDRPA